MMSKRVSSLSVVFLWTGAAFAGALSLSPVPDPSVAAPGGTLQIQAAPLNPEFEAWRASKRAGAITALASGVSGGVVPSPFDDSYLRYEEPSVPIRIAVPSRYDLRDYGWVTPVKDQAGCGACFAFATYSSLESWLLKNASEQWDFSENHVKNYPGFDGSPCDEGGHPLMTTAYLVRGDGPVEEKDDPFHDRDEPSSPGGTVCKYVRSVRWFYDAQDMKNAVMTHGALYAPMYLDPQAERSPLYNAATNTYYNCTPYSKSHAVAVIGWDDAKDVPGAATKGA
ncbi:MAG: hypothetical protein MUC88_22035 [Planctomycetes bacterium]|nr:hypothetical protein [Planctomycetota bacterium]